MFKKEDIYCKECGAWLSSKFIDCGELVMQTHSSDYVEGQDVCKCCLEKKQENTKEK